LALPARQADGGFACAPDTPRTSGDEFAGAKSEEDTMDEKNGVISPEGLPREAMNGVSRHLDTLEGKTIGEVYNNHFKGELMFNTYRRLFKERFPGIKVISFDEFPTVFVGGDPDSQKKTAREIARLAKERGCDAIITGNGG
jgi:hypothetical protein